MSTSVLPMALAMLAGLGASAVIAAPPNCPRIQDTQFPLPYLTTVPSGAWNTIAGDGNGDGLDEDLIVALTRVSDRTRVEVFAVLPDTNGGLAMPRIIDFGLSPQTNGPGHSADINGDGRKDFVLTRSGSSLLRPSTDVALASSDGGFDAPANWPLPTVESLGRTLLADVDGDRVAELIMLVRGSTLVFHFTNALGWTLSSSAALPSNWRDFEEPDSSDLDGDGYGDLFLTRVSGARELLVLFGDSVAPLATWNSYGLEGGWIQQRFDQNGDGRSELLGLESGSEHQLVLRQITHTTRELVELWRQPIPPQAEPVTIADANADGLDDVVISYAPVNAGEDAQRVLLNNGSGPLAQGFQFHSSHSIRFFRDLDGDGFVDAIIRPADRFGPYSAYRGSALNEFDEEMLYIPGEPGQYIRAGDLDHDGTLDLVVWTDVPRYSSPIPPLDVRHGLGGGRYETVSNIPHPGNYSEIYLEDIDSDGHPDLLATTGNADRLRRVWVAYGADAFNFERWRSYPLPLPTSSLVFGDLDGDKRLDLVAETDSLYSPEVSQVVPIFVDGRSWSVRLPIAIDPHKWVYHRLQLADIDGDGRADLVHALSVPEAPLRVVARRTGAGRTIGDAEVVWEASSNAKVDVLVARDFDGDQRVDLLLQTNTGYDPSPTGDSRLRLLKGDGHGRFTTMFRDPDLRYFNLIGVLDADLDGQLDLMKGDGPSLRLGRGDGTFPAWSGGWIEAPRYGDPWGDFLGDGGVQQLRIRQIGGEWWYKLARNRGRRLDTDAAPPDVTLQLVPAPMTDNSPIGFEHRWRIASALSDDCDSAPTSQGLIAWTPPSDAPVHFVLDTNSEIRVYQVPGAATRAIVLHGPSEVVTRALLEAASARGGIEVSRGDQPQMRVLRDFGPTAQQMGDGLDALLDYRLVERFGFAGGRIDLALVFQPGDGDLIVEIQAHDRAGHVAHVRESWWRAREAYCLGAEARGVLCE